MDLVANCDDEYPDCAANYYDCNEDCGGGAVVDECGNCGGDGPQVECWDGLFVCEEEKNCIPEPENLFFSEYIEGTSSKSIRDL